MPPLRSHWVLRGVLLASLLVLIGVLARDYQVKQPGYLMRRAREARVRHDRASALIFLRTLLAYDPRCAEGHLLFAEICLEAAQANDPGARLADVLPALDHFRCAAELKPRDAEIQRVLMDAEAQTGQLDRAAAAAQRLVPLRPDDADAHYILAAKALGERNDDRAARHLNELARLEPQPRFRTMAARAERLKRVGPDEELDVLVDHAAAKALRLSADPVALRSLVNNDRAAMLALLFRHEQHAVCVPEAIARAETGLTVLERLAALAPKDERLAGEVAQHAAVLVENVETLLPRRSGRDGAPPHLAVLTRFEELAAVSIADGTASAAVAERAALVAVVRGDDARARTLLETALRELAGQSRTKPEELAALRLLLARRLFATDRGRDASQYLKPLFDLPFTIGWAELFTGTLQLDEGKDAAALEHLFRARERLGDRALVRVACARAFIALSRWQEANEQLYALDRMRDRLDAEDRAWLRHALGDTADLHRLIAWAHAELGQWAQAQPHLDALKDTRHVGWAVRVAAARRAREQGPGDAVATLERARHAAPARLDLVLSEVALLTAQGKDDEASAVLEQFAAGRSDDLAAQASLLRWRLARGRHESAKAQAAALVDRLPDHPVARLLWAETLLAIGQTGPALTLCQALAGDASVARSAPEVYRVAPLVGALAAARLQQRSESARLLEQAGRVLQDPATHLLLEGGVALVRDDDSVACSKFAEALAYTAVREPARVALTQAVMSLAASKSPGAAEAALECQLDRFPNEPVLRVLLVELALRRDRFDVALEQVAKLSAVPTSLNEARFLRVLITARRGQWNQAHVEAVALLKRQPDHLQARLLLVQLLLALHKEPEALAEANEVLRRSPDHPDGVLLRADALERLGRRDDTIVSLEAYVARQPRLPAPRLRLALLYASAGRGDKSGNQLELARGSATDPALLLRTHIQCLCRLGQPDVAEPLALAAMRGERTTELALGVSDAFAAEQQWRRAAAWTEKALKHADDELRPKLWARAADFLVLQARVNAGDKTALLEAACVHWRAILARAPGDLVAANNLAWFLATELGRSQEARDVAYRAWNGAPVEELPEQFIATLATIERRLDRLAEARVFLEQRVALRPEEPLTHLHLGLLYQAEKRPIVARQALLRALQLGLDADHEQQARSALEGAVVK